MSDQPVLRDAGAGVQTPMLPPGQKGVQTLNGMVSNRLRRGALHRADRPDNVTHISAPVRGHPAGKPPSAQPAPAISVFAKPGPRRDKWASLRLAPPGVRRHFLSGAPLVNFFRHDPAARAFDRLRTQLLQTLRAKGWTRIAIASPTPGCGSTFTAVNLAQSLARIPGSRTVLMDINHRTPGIAGMLDLEGIGDMRRYLTGEVALERQMLRSCDTLALGLISHPDQDAAEILHDPRCARTLAQMIKVLSPDVVLYDLPPVLAYDDFAAFLRQVDGVLLVADGTQTLPGHITACKEMLDGQTPLLGVILNRARDSGLKTN